jgi:pimeloyl-ACP methyl ester carboxylesterase
MLNKAMGDFDEQFKHQMAEVNGVRIHYVIGGEGEAVVLLHGFPSTWFEWRKVMPQLAAKYTVIAPDLRGMGDSEKPEAGYAKTNVAEDVRQLARQLGFGEVNLVGKDIGMMVAYAYAAAHPDEVRRLVLCEALIPGFGLEELMNPATGGYWHFGFHMQVDIAEMLTKGKEADYLLPMWGRMARVNGMGKAAVAEYLRCYSAPGGMRGGFQHYKMLLEDGKTNRADFHGKLKMPVLSLNGDHGIPQEQTLHGVRQVAENVTAELIPNSGHAFAEENPDWVADRLIRFFDSE